MNRNERVSRLNPQRDVAAARVLESLRQHGGKMYLTSSRQASLQRETRLSRHAVTHAIDDLYQLGAVDMRLVGETTVVLLVRNEMYGTDTRLGKVVTERPRITLSKSRKGAWR